MPPDPLLLRPRTAVVVCIAAVAVAGIVAAGGAQALIVAVALWALCVVCAVRGALRRRGRVTALYTAGAAPVTAGLALLAWVSVHG